MRTESFDVVVFGVGAAGLAVALSLPRQYRVALVSKTADTHLSSTSYAQGGIAVAHDDDDSFAAHSGDTLTCGHGLCDPLVVSRIIEAAPAAINWLESMGVHFTRGDDNRFHLHREGGHGVRRVAHVGDTTGAALQRALTARLADRPNITLFTRIMLMDVIVEDDVVRGAYAYDVATRSVMAFVSAHIVLATGGAGKAYLYTSGPDTATGDGMAAAWRAGCSMMNMEFTQFHPTCLYHPAAKSFLLTEALRGEGAVLQLADGTRFMSAYHPDAELAPRDVVAKAIDSEMKRLGCDCVYLDISHRGRAFVEGHFPMISARLKTFGFDLAASPVPVVPAAHYNCGGIRADVTGRTDISGLYAIGEVACTGLHGANRLASNSLLECLVCGRACADWLADTTALSTNDGWTPAPWDVSFVRPPREAVSVNHNWDAIRRLMWDFVGIVRRTEHLLAARARLAIISHEIMRYYQRYLLTQDVLELRNIALVAELMVESALRRQESRGLHCNADYPDTLPVAQPTLLVPPHVRGLK